MIQLRCSVQHCAAHLERQRGSLVCARGHTFNIARSGYCNLLQPQDRHSRQPGDSKAVVQARRRLFDAGYGAALLAALIEVFDQDRPRTGAAVLDAGCGEGFHLAALQQQFALDACGIDISVEAIDAAAKRYKNVQWIVANADRRLPFDDQSFARILSVTGRRSGGEFRRVIEPAGLLVIAVPAGDDQAELRQAVLGAAHETDRMPALCSELAGAFVLESHSRSSELRHFDSRNLIDLLTTTYRGARQSLNEHIAQLSALDVTLAYDIACFRPI